jgi:hypothetical protein
MIDARKYLVEFGDEDVLENPARKLVLECRHRNQSLPPDGSIRVRMTK